MEPKSVLGLSADEKTFLLIAPTLAGALLGWALPGIAGWAGKLPFIPFQGILKWISAFESNWIPIVTAGLGAIAGIVFALYILDESLSITVTGEEVVIFHKDTKIVLTKNNVKAVFPEGKDLVFTDCEGTELYRGQADVNRKSAAQAFRMHGYPWYEKDPYFEQYQRWVPDHPGYPQHVNALLSARERALQKDEKEEAAALRRDLTKLGVMIHDEERRQYIRMNKAAG